jgi:hypothetical protein
MKIIISESQYNLLKEIDLLNMDDLIKVSLFLSSVGKSNKKTLNEFLELIRKSGLVNMLESSQFLFMTKEHFDDMIRFKSHSRKYDEDQKEIFKEISSKIGQIRDIMIGIAVKYTELNDMELTTQNINNSLRKVINSTLAYWAQGLLKK